MEVVGVRSCGLLGGECLVIVSVAVLVGATHGNIAFNMTPNIHWDAVGIIVNSAVGLR